MTILQILQHLVFGMFLGAVVGIDREREAKLVISKFAGIRTFTLIGLYGVLIALIEKISIPLFIVMISGFIVLIIASYITHSLKHQQNGVTSELASFIVLISGYFVGNDNYTVASMIIMSTAVLLYAKDKIHEFAGKVTSAEIKSVIQFVTIAFIILPLLPNQNFGPYDSLNPYVIWTMIVIISGISFLSYLAVRLIGHEKGISLSGFLGGLVSSTAVTLAFSQDSKKHKHVVYPFVFGIIIAGTAMFFRILATVSVVNPSLVSSISIPLLTSGITGLIVSAGLWYLQSKESKNKSVATTQDIDLGKPLDLYSAIKFGLLFAIVLILVKFMSANFGDRGIYATSILSGFFDTDAISVSLANLAKTESITPFLATAGITLATLTNTFIKGVFVLFLASRPVAIRTIISVLIIVAAGLISLLFV